MSERDDRFRRLQSRSASRPAETGDLFRHYGIALEPEPSTAIPTAVRAAPCRSCGWYLPRERSPAACPLCAVAEPLASSAGNPA